MNLFKYNLQKEQSPDQGTKRPSAWHRRFILPHAVFPIIPHPMHCLPLETALVVLAKHSIHSC